MTGGTLSTDATASIHLNSCASLSNVQATGNIVLSTSSPLTNVTFGGTVTQTLFATLAGTITNNANWTSSGTPSISISGPVLLTGNGTFTGNGFVNNTGSNSTLTIGANQTVTGNLTFSSILPLINLGTIASAATSNLHIDSANFTNAGNLSATGGATLDLNGFGALINYGGTISASGTAAPAGGPSTVSITSYAVSGGLLTTDAVASIRLSNATLNDVQVNGNLVVNGPANMTDVSLAGNVTQSNVLTLAGTITNNANWTATGAYPDLIFGKVLLAGNGTVTLAGSSFNGASPSASLTIGPAQTLLGHGTIASSPNLGFTNLGTINSTSQSIGFAFNIGNTGNLANPSMINAGTISSTNGSNLSITGSTTPAFLLNTGGTISVSGTVSGNGNLHSVGLLNFITVYGGQITTDSIDSITLTSVNLQNVQFSGNAILSGTGNNAMVNDTLSGSVTSNSGSITTLNGGITSNAFWTNSGSIVFNGSQTLAGNGTITLTGGTMNSNLSVATVTFPATQSIKGYGNVGLGGYGLGIDNAGIIAATPNPTGGNVSNFTPLSWTLPGGYNSINSGNISALGGSTLTLNSANLNTTLDNTGGTFSATGSGNNGASLSHINITAISITGGTLLTDALDSIQFNGNNTLADLSASGNLILNNGTLGLRNVSLSGNLTQFPGANTLLSGTLTNNGNWIISGNSNITVGGAQTIQGTGSVLLNGGSIATAVGVGPPKLSILTNAGGSVIQGTGTIGDSNMAAILNFGRFDANSTAPLGLVFAAPLTNNGDLSIEQNCLMTINGPFNAAAGIIHDNGTLTINGPITGSINQVGNGTLIINPSFVTTTKSAFGNALVILNGNLNAISTAAGNATLVVATGKVGAPGLVSDGLQLNTLTINGALQIRTNGSSTGTSKLQHLTLAGSQGSWTGALDLTNNFLIVEITGGSTLPTLIDQINYGITSAIGPSTPGGIFTSSPGMEIALIDNSALPTPLTTFGGVPVDNNSILLAGALLGDANLDGHVDLSDLSIVLNNFGQPTTSWLAGNFHHEQAVDLTDLSDVLNNFGQVSSPAGPVTALGGQAAAAPEPASLLMVAAVPLLMTRRARLRGLHGNGKLRGGFGGKF